MKRVIGVALLFALMGAMGPMRAARAADSFGNGLYWPLLKRGASGYQVRAAQRLLRARGYKTAVDGKLGFGTESLLRKFQRARKLKVDGTVGAQTWAALTPTLRRGSRGEAVRALQELLNLWQEGLMLDNMRYPLPVRVDGTFGAATTRAMQKFQDGLFGGAPIADDGAWCYLLGGHADGE